ncbi:hypothetical protein DFP72DRAFT_1128797 [Ephemerocybe angulata]|uniref:Uncharacterized protein n=1 Tax=Ephemerocybe angulata TaxID=980116 RepID=A0A8H6HV83_9AGAR|nr:hypothetical protein DFP72DRAFT_1111202 [Tulosesus angulatus]KAF6753490.1 hypothetical protein DFP72DRAFT_1128797 [Tulosesus angulatus]
MSVYRDYSFFNHLGVVYFSPNCSKLPSRVPREPSSELPNPFDANTTSWRDFYLPIRWTAQYGWLAFTPLVHLDVYPLDRLSYIPSMVNIDGKGWSLPKDTIEQWDRLTDHLRAIAERLCATYSVPCVLPFTPCGMGYRRTAWPTRGKASAMAHRSKDWFMVWAGLIAYIVCYIETLRKTQPESNEPQNMWRVTLPPHWKDTLREMGYSQAWIDGIEFVTNAPVPRAGIFFNSLEEALVPPIPDGPTIQFFYRSNVPVWYRWDESVAGWSDPEDLLPPVELRYLALKGQFEAIPDSPASPPPSRRSWSPTPTPEIAKPREDWDAPDLIAARAKRAQAIFKELRQKDAALREKETAAGRERRENRERENPIKTAPVCVWETDPANPADLKSYIVNSKQREDEIETHSEAQRVYFSSLNAWHLCRDLAIGEGWTDEHDEVDDDDEDLGYQAALWKAANDQRFPPPAPSCPPLPQPAPSSPVRAPSPPPAPSNPEPTERFRDAGTSTGTNDDEGPMVERQISADMATYFGFVAPIPYPEQDSFAKDDFPIHKDNRTKVWFMRALGYPLERPGVSGFLQSVTGVLVWKFYQAFSEKRERDKPAKALGNHFDLDPGCHSPLSARCLDVMRVVSRPSPLPPMYVFTFEGPYLLAVHCPAIALAVCRLYHRGMETIVRTFNDIGVQFNTLARVPGPTPTIRPSPSPFSLPVRPENYNFEADDYWSYRRLLESVTHGRRMRAAGMRGGILWRICAGSLYNEDIVDGPSNLAVPLRCSLDNADHHYVDDELSETETLFLIGAYKIPTMRSGEFITKSWWPHPSVFEQNGDYQGIWTDWLERWYKDRLQKIEEGAAMPLSVKGWKKIKGSPQMTIWRKRLVEESTKFIVNSTNTLPATL